VTASSTRRSDGTSHPFDAASRLKDLTLWAGILGAAGFAAILALGHPLLALLLAGLVLATSVVALRGDLPDRLGNHRWIPYAWIALILSASFRFTFSDTLDPSTSATTENKVQILVYLAVALLVLHSRRLLVEHDRRRIRKGPLLAWPMLAVASALWSLVPLFTLVRSLQLLVPVGLVVVMARIWIASPETAVELWRKTLRLFVQAVTILELWGFAAGGWQDRYTWPGFHPITAATFLSIAILILLANGPSFLKLGRFGYVVRLLFFATGIYLGETRGALAGIAVGLAALIWFAGRQKPLTRYLGLMYYGIALLLLLVVALPAILHYLERGGNAQTLTTLNGRIGLWEVSIDLIGDAGKWITGFGYGAARVILPLQVNWAGTAHSYWVELFLGLGISGVLLAVADVLFLFRHLSSRVSLTPSAATLSLLMFLVVNSFVSEILAYPGVGFGMLALLHAPVLAQLSSRVGSTDALSVAARRTPMSLHGREDAHDPIPIRDRA
jgi:hypothetical protein